MTSTGHIANCELDIKEPVQFQCMHLTMNNINLYVGTNGSGKTFVLVNFFCLNYIAQGIVGAFVQGLVLTDKEHLLLAQHTYDHSYSDQNIDGRIKCTWQSGAWIELLFEKGKVTSMTHDGLYNLSQPLPVKFLSAGMRTFDDIQLYLRLRGVLQKVVKSDEQLLEELLKNFKLYDVVYLEGLIKKMPMKVTQEIRDRLAGFDIKEPIELMAVDLQKPDFYLVDDKGTKKYLTTYGKGHQSLFNMTLGIL